jgi:DNA-binding response OmpR family regulator
MNKVLLVDNDESVLDMMQEALNYGGYDVKAISQTENIMPEIDTYHPDLVILDYILTGINGGELCHQIKVNKKTSKLPVVLVSAYPKVLKSLGDYGADDFISKPFDLDDFLGRVKSLINKPMDKHLHVI